MHLKYLDGLINLKNLFFICFLMFVLLMSGCTSDSDDGRIKVYTSFYTMYDLTSKIAGDNARVYNLMPQGDAHDFELSTRDIINLNKADVFVYNGLGMEHWVDSLMPTLENPDLKVVKASQGVTVIDSDEHEEEHSEELNNHGAIDPHIWLSPINAKVILFNIKDALIQADPDNAAEYQENYDKYAAECDKLDDEYKTALQGFEKKDIVVTHQAFSYLCKEYNLNQIAFMGIHAEESDMSKTKEIISLIKSNNIKVVFYEPAHGKDLASSLNRETGVQVEIAPLNPLESLSEDEIKNNADYFSVMRQNLAQIVNALQLQNGI